MKHSAVDGFCPMCGCRSLGVEISLIRSPTPIVRCYHPDCPDPEGLSKILMDSEIHHVVRFNEAGYFNVKHPLREIAGELLDCTIHDVITDIESPGVGKWRLVGVPAIPSPSGGVPQEADWNWEEL